MSIQYEVLIEHEVLILHEVSLQHVVTLQHVRTFNFSINFLRNVLGKADSGVEYSDFSVRHYYLN